MELVNKIHEYIPGGLIATSDVPPREEVVIIAAGSGQLPSGRILGQIAASGNFTSVDSSKSDGSQTAYGILKKDIDATTNDVKAIVYVRGDFKINMLSCGGTDTPIEHKETLRVKNIHLTRED